MIDPAITHPKNAEERSAQANAVVAAMQEGVRDALIRHKRLGEPIVVWEDGQVRWIPAEEIVIPPSPSSLSP